MGPSQAGMPQYILKWNLINCSGSLHPNIPPLGEKTHVRGIKRGTSSSGRKDFNDPPAKALRLAITPGENGESEWKKPARSSGPAQVFQVPGGDAQFRKS